MQLTGNMSSNWLCFKQVFKMHLKAEEKISKPDKIKIALLLNTTGVHCLDIYNSFVFDAGDADKYSKVVEGFDKHFIPKKNTVFTRHKIFNCKQKDK